MLQLPHTVTAGNSAVIASAGGEVFPTDVRSLIALHREADAAIDAAQTDAEMEPHSRRAEWIYRTLVSVTPGSLQEEAERLSYVLAYIKTFTAADGQLDGGWLDMPELSHIAKNLTKLAKPVGPDALKVVSKNIQPLKLCPEPKLNSILDHLQAEGDVTGMVVLYDYYIALADTTNATLNEPRAGSVDHFVEHYSDRFYAKAYAVADRLKRLTPTSERDRNEQARTLIAAAFLMDASVGQVADLMQHLRGVRE